MDVSLFDYELPGEGGAQEPAEPRDASRLLVLDRARGAREDARFSDLPRWLRAGGWLVLTEGRGGPASLAPAALAPGGGLPRRQREPGDPGAAPRRPRRRRPAGGASDAPPARWRALGGAGAPREALPPRRSRPAGGRRGARHGARAPRFGSARGRD